MNFLQFCFCFRQLILEKQRLSSGKSCETGEYSSSEFWRSSLLVNDYQIHHGSSIWCWSSRAFSHRSTEHKWWGHVGSGHYSQFLLRLGLLLSSSSSNFFPLEDFCQNYKKFWPMRFHSSNHVEEHLDPKLPDCGENFLLPGFTVCRRWSNILQDFVSLITVFETCDVVRVKQISSGYILKVRALTKWDCDRIQDLLLSTFLEGVQQLLWLAASSIEVKGFWLRQYR